LLKYQKPKEVLMKKFFIVVLVFLGWKGILNGETITPNKFGLAGTYRVFSAQTLPKRSFSLTLMGNYERSSDFVNPLMNSPAMYETQEGYRLERIEGDLAISYSFFEYLETGINLYSSATSMKDRVSRDDFIQSIGDVDIFIKGVYMTRSGIGVGGVFHPRFYTKVERIGMDMDSTSLGISFIWTIDLYKARRTPFRANFNIGYFWDNSSELTSPDTVGSNDIFYALRMIPDSNHIINGGISVEFPFKEVTPFIEYTTEQAVSSDNFRRRRYNENPQRITPGFKFTPGKNLLILLGADVSFFKSKKFGNTTSRPIPLWTANFGISYTFLPPQIIELVPPPPPPPTTGTIEGKVIDSVSKKPVGDVIILLVGTDLPRFASNRETGDFRITDVPGGEIEISATKEGYKPASTKVNVEVGKTVSVVIEIEKEEEFGFVAGRVTDPFGVPVIASVSTDKPEIPPSAVDPKTGEYKMKLSPGTYKFTASAEGYVSQTQEAVVKNRETTTLHFVLSKVEKPLPPPPPPPPPKKPLVILERAQKKIEIKEQIFFEFGKARILPVSYPLLDEIARVMIENPDLVVEVQGHTDNKGSYNFNMKLSQDRANAVREYLIKKGVEPERLKAVGYGPTKPIADNSTEEGRAKNRRVEFVIIKQKE
jgi:outer membrane protein OmpA-like peptidoglycan-associated protein